MDFLQQQGIQVKVIPGMILYSCLPNCITKFGNQKVIIEIWMKIQCSTFVEAAMNWHWY